MNSQKKNNSIQHLKNMCSDKMSFETKLFLLSSPARPLPRFIEFLIIIIDYIQLLAQSILLNNYFYNTTASNFNTLFANISTLSKVILPAYFLTFNDTNSVYILVFFLLLLYLVIKYLLVAYIVIVANRGIKPPRYIRIIWIWFFKLHSRVIYLVFTSFWTSIYLAASQEKYNPLSMGNVPISSIAICVIVVEYLFSLLIHIRYAYLLPSKSLLSSKDNKLEIIVLTQKFLIQILEIAMTANSGPSSLAFTILNFCISILSIGYHIKVLPLYNIQALVLEGSLLSLNVCVNLIFILRTAISMGDNERLSMDYALLLGFVMTPIFVKSSIVYLNRKILELVTQYNKSDPEILIHKINAIRQFRKNQTPVSDYARSYDHAHLVHNIYNLGVETVFNIDYKPEEGTGLHFENRESANRLFLAYLEHLSLLFPKDSLVKLYLAFYYGKKLKMYGTAIKYLFGLQQSTFSSKVRLTASILMYETQNKLKLEYENSKNKIDFSTYINSLTIIAQFKEKVLEQADLQIKVCQEFNDNKPDIFKIFNLSQRIGDKREELDEYINMMLTTLPENNLEPLILAGRYSLVLNHSIIDYINSAKAYAKKCERFARQLNELTLSQGNLYQKDNGFMMITTQGGSTGLITYCNKSTEYIYGTNVAGSQAYTITPPMLQNFFFEFFKNPMDQTYKTYFGNVVRSFAYHRSGYLVEMDFYLNIHPYISQGLYYNLVVRPVKTTTQYIMLDQHGVIGSYTKDIGNKLGLFASRDATIKNNITIGQVSKELERISFASRMVAQPQNNKKKATKQVNRSNTVLDEVEVPDELDLIGGDMKAEEANLLYTVFNSEGRHLTLKSLKQDASDRIQSYHCKIENRYYNSNYFILLILEKTELDEDDAEEVNNLIWNTAAIIANPGLQESLNKKWTGERKSGDFYSHDLVAKRTVTTQLQPQENEFEDGDFFETMDERTARTDQSPPGGLRRSRANMPEELTTPNLEMAKTNLMRSKEAEFTNSSKIGNTPGQLNNAKGNMEEKWDLEEKNAVEKLENVQQSLGSQKSKSSASGRRVYKALKEALNMNSSPKYYNVFILTLYTLMGLVFGAQLGLKLVLDTDLGGRNSEKDVLRSSETRNDILIGIQREVRYLHDLSIGRLTQADLGFAGKTISGYIASIGNNLNTLSELNNELLVATGSLSDEFRSKLFGRNVKVYETYYDEPVQSYILLNNFQTADRIIESGYKALDLAPVNFTDALIYMKFIYRNALNDFLIKCDEISDIFIQSLDNNKDTTQNNFTYILIVTLLLILAIIVISGYIIVRQYGIEKKHLNAFIRLNPQKVKEVLDSVVRFKRVIQDDIPFEEVSNSDIGKFMRGSIAKVEFSAKKSVRNAHLNHPDFRGIFRKYVFYFVTLLFLMAVLVGFTALSYVTAADTVNKLQEQLRQIQFSDRLSVRLNQAVICTQELMTNNDTTMIRDVKVSEQLEVSIEDIKIMRQQLSTVFQSSSSTYSDQIDDIIFNDACTYLTGNANRICEVISQGSDQVGLMYSASLLESGITDRRDKFATMNRTEENLVNLQITTLNTTVYPNNILNSGTTVISDWIEQSYEQDIAQAETDSNTIWGVSFAALVIVGILVWFGLIKKIMEADGKFKRVLQTLPTNVVLSNLILKSYLLETSRGALDFVRNDI